MSEETSASAPKVAAETRGGKSRLPGLPKEVEQRLVAEHGEIAIVRTPLGPFAFRAPAQEDFERFVDRVAQDKSKKVAAARELCNLSLVYPADLGTLETVFERFPALAVSVANKLQELAGQDFEVEVKKG